MLLHFSLFVVMVTSLIIVPGPDMLYVVGRSIVRGHVAGLYSARGVSFGYTIFTILVAAGVGLIFENNQALFNIIKICGLLYLSFLAYRLFNSDGMVETGGVSPVPSFKSDFIFGIITSTLNPKGILFYFSILPQFFVVGSGPLWQQAVLYGVTTSLLCLMIYYFAGVGAIYGLRRWQMNARRRKILSRMSGLVLLVAIAILILTTTLPSV